MVEHDGHVQDSAQARDLPSALIDMELRKGQQDEIA
jgi:hypothetical protein